MINFFDVLGLMGVALIIFNYGRLQMKREFAKRIAYSAGNFLGSLLVVISLLDQWNLSAFIVNAIMGGISAYGVYRCLKYKNATSSEKSGEGN